MINFDKKIFSLVVAMRVIGFGVAEIRGDFLTPSQNPPANE